MKKWLRLLTAMLLVLTLAFAPALAETTEPTATPEVADTADSADDASVEETVEEEVEEEESWAEDAFGSLLGMNWYTLMILVVLVVVGVILCARSRSSWTARRMAYAAMCIAIAFVLSCIKLFRMPQGGSVTPAAMLPLILFALACGPVQGVVVGCAFGLLQLIEDFYVIHPIQLLVDYPMAYAALALACVVNLPPIKNDRIKLPLAVLLGYLGRYIMATISGAVFFAEYAGEQNAWIYSLSYNISYLGVEAVIACVIACIPGFDRILAMMKKKV